MSSSDEPVDALTIMASEDCLAQLREGYQGRLGYVDGDRPVIVSMNYRLSDDDEIVLAARTGLKLDLAHDGATMCLQIDWVTDEHRSGGSVLVTGPTRVLGKEAGQAQMLQLRLRPWAGEDHVESVIVLTPDRIEGRRLR